MSVVVADRAARNIRIAVIEVDAAAVVVVHIAVVVGNRAALHIERALVDVNACAVAVVGISVHCAVVKIEGAVVHNYKAAVLIGISLERTGIQRERAGLLDQKDLVIILAGNRDADLAGRRFCRVGHGEQCTAVNAEKIIRIRADTADRIAVEIDRDIFPRDR